MPGETERATCSLCGKAIVDGDEFTTSPAFLPASHRLSPYANTSMHLECFDNWKDRDEFSALFGRWKRINDPHPIGMSDDGEAY